MQSFQFTPASSSLRQRILGAAAAAGATVAVVGLTLSLFATASTVDWLPDTPEAAAQARACTTSSTDRAAREGCMRALVARWQAGERRGIHVASSR